MSLEEIKSKGMRVLIVITGLLLALPVFSFAQTRIGGRVLGEGREPIAGAGITAALKPDGAIKTFAFSDRDGNFSLAINFEADSVILSVSQMGYENQVRKIANRSQEVEFTLSKKAFELTGVVVRAPVIERIGDTIIYHVPAFIRAQDRVIGDVLRRLPGIDVLSDGRILYQGRPIQKFYIEGLDLLGGRYNLASQNLPARAVSQVQIIENHQPIRILEERVFSDQASLNIRLNRDVTWTGTAQLGSGIAPALWDVSATPMLFTGNHQMLLSYQTNNTGENVASELNVLTIEALIDRAHTLFEKNEWVQVQTLPRPGLSERAWLDNNSHLVTANYLRRLERDFELRLNTSYLNDIHRQEGSAFSQIFTPADTISFFQNVNNKMRDHSLENKLTLTRNIPRKYLRNELEINTGWDTRQGFVNEGMDGFLNVRQEVKSPEASVSNRFRTMLPVGDHIVALRSYTSYINTSQSLHVRPGPFAGLLNNAIPYDALHQDVNLAGFFTHNSISTTMAYNIFSFTPSVGFLLRNRELSTGMAKWVDGNTETLGSDFVNDLEFNQTSTYASLQNQFRYKTWRVEASGRLVYNQFGIHNLGHYRSDPVRRIDFEPSLSVHKDLNPRWRISSFFSTGNSYGTIDQLYEGFILTHYRQLQRNSAEFLEQRNQSLRFSGDYRNPLLARFFNLAYAYSRTHSNLIFLHEIDPSGNTLIQTHQRPNIRHTHQVNFRWSRHLRELRTNITLNPNYFLTTQEFKINDDFVNIQSHHLQANARLEKEIFTWFDAMYSASIGIGMTDIGKIHNQRFSVQSHKLHLNLFPATNHRFNLDMEYYRSVLQDNANSCMLFNMSYNFKLPQRRLEMYLTWNNILNNRNFHTIISSQYSIISRSYLLRPSQLQVGLRFSLQ